MDKYYGNVCELDIIFSFTKAYYILDEILLAGELQESSKKNVLRCIGQQDSLEDMEVSFMVLGDPLLVSTPTIFWFLPSSRGTWFTDTLCYHFPGRGRGYENHVITCRCIYRERAAAKHWFTRDFGASVFRVEVIASRICKYTHIMIFAGK